MSSKTKIILAIVILVVIGGCVAFTVIGANSASAEVETATAQKEGLEVSVTAAGRVETGVSASVYPPAAGVLAGVEVEDGDQVKAGAVIATMDTDLLEAQRLQAEAALAQAESQLAAVNEQNPSSEDIAAAQASTDAAWAGYQAALVALDAVDGQAPSATDIAAAEAATAAAYSGYQLAAATYEALKASIEASSSPSPEAIAELAATETAKDQAYAGYLQAKSAEEMLKGYNGEATEAQAKAAADQAYAGYLGAKAQQAALEGLNLSSSRAAAQAGVDQARHALILAEDALANYELTAPIDGVVFFNPTGAPGADGSTPMAEEGSSVAPQSPPFTVTDLNGLRFTVSVDEFDISRVKIGMPAEIMLDGFPDRSFDSTVSAIKVAAQLTETGGSAFPVHFSLAGSDEKILIGMKGDARIEVDMVPDAITVPVEALFDEGGTTFVYLIEDETLARTEVEVGRLTETQVQIISGIQEGDPVALSGPIELVDGMRVKVD